MASEQKANTAQKGGEVLDFDPRRLREDQRVSMRVPVTITDDGEKITVLVPTEGNESEGVLVERALEFATNMKASEETLGRRLSPNGEDNLLQQIAMTTTLVVLLNLGGVGRERFGEEEFDEAVRGNDDPDAVLEEISGARFNHFAGEFLARLRNRGGKELALLTHQAAYAGVIRAFREEHDVDALSDEEYDRLLKKVEREHYDESLLQAVEMSSAQLAEAYLDNIRPSRMTLEELVRLYRGEQKSPGNFVIPTDPISNVMRKTLIQATLAPYEEHVRIPESPKDLVRVRGSVSIDSLISGATEFERQEDVLVSIQKKLLAEKQNAAALLKLHLDLTNQAYAAGGELPLFEYNFAEALERLGYSRNAVRRGFHRDAMRGLRERLIVLRSHQVAAWHTKRGNKERLETTPYWVIQTYHYNAQDPLDLVDMTSTLLRREDSVAYTGVTIHPGFWWATTNMKQYRLSIPESLLQLPTDGNGNERERLTLLLATFLAIHVRRNQRQHAGKSVAIRVGTLLEESGIITREAFFEQKSRDAGRLRDYLHDIHDKGALPLLGELGAFNVTIQDEAGFFAAGRGWPEKFWEALLEVEVPDLEIRKSLEG